MTGQNNVAKIDPAEVRRHLSQMLEREPFSGSPRLQSFLTYIVEEKLAGREDQIVGKAIAEEVYGRKIGSDWKDEPIVRVDAGRLRRSLKTYYSGQGKDDPLQIEIPTGAYKPQFVLSSQSTESAQQSNPGGLMWAGIAAIATVAVMAVVLTNRQLEETGPVVGEAPAKVSSTQSSGRAARMELERRAMFDKSPTSLQAYDFAHKARELIFPPTNPARLKTAMELFQQSIKLDPDYFGGHAGAAQILAFHAFLGPPDKVPQLLQQARDAAKRAQSLNATNAWVHSAMAWVEFVGRDFNRSLELVQRSIKLDPADHHNRNFNGMILIFNGDFAEAREFVAAKVQNGGLPPGSIEPNILAVSSFYLKDYAQTVKTIQQVMDTGGSSSSLTASYLSAAYLELGESERARTVANGLYKAWPDFKPEPFFRRIFRHRQHADKVIDGLRRASGRSVSVQTAPNTQ